MNSEQFSLQVERLYHQHRQLLAMGTMRAHRPTARLLVEFYVNRFGHVRCIVDGIAHDNRQDIPFNEFCHRASFKDEYHTAMAELKERSEISGLSVLEYVQKVFGDRFPKWDLVVRDGKSVRVDENEVEWNGYTV